MTTSDFEHPVLLIRQKTGRIIGVCSAGCYNAEGFNCTCICGGVNHGVGRKQAAQNVVDGLKPDWTRTWAKVPKRECKVIIPRGVAGYAEQMEFFDKHEPQPEERQPCRLPSHQF